MSARRELEAGRRSQASLHWVLSLLVSLSVVLIACASKKGGASGVGAASSGKGGKKLEYPVEVAKVEARPVEFIVTAPGETEAFERVQVTARVAGAIDKVAFSEGTEVKKGQVLVTIESARYELAVEQANVALERMAATEADAELALKRREDAVIKTPGIVPEEEVQTYRTKLRIAKADVQQAKETLKQANLNLHDAFVRAPMDGVMQSRSVETGQYVQPGLILGFLLRRDPLLLRFQVSTQEAPRIKPGMIATFTLRETLRVYTAKITLVAGAADAKSHLVAITGEVDDKEHAYWLRPGSFCDVALSIGAARLQPLIPQTAIRPNERGFLAYVVEGNIAKERVLKLGMHTPGGLIEVTDGLKAGELLVVRGAEPLVDGSPVKIASTTTIPYASSSSSVFNPVAPWPPPSASASASGKPSGAKP